jgi:hypothetical protein
MFTKRLQYFAAGHSDIRSSSIENGDIISKVKTEAIMKQSMWLAVFLASFLIVGSASGATYYISASTGSDAHTAASAKSKTTPWAHAPGMANCALNCANYTPVAGDRFIFKGGETWGNASFKWAWNWSGTSGARIYLGVDQSWYTGRSWTRPIFDAEGMVMSSGNVFLRNNGNYVTVDNIEFRGFFGVAGQGFGNNTYINPGASTGMILEHCYLHGWSTESDALVFVAITGNPAFPSLTVDFTVRYNVFSGKDSPEGLADPDCTSSCRAKGSAMFNGISYMYGNYCEYVITCYVGSAFKEAAYNWFTELRLTTDGLAHGNLFESILDGPGAPLFHDNVLCNNRVAGAVTLWLIPEKNSTTYAWNNVICNPGIANIVNLGDGTPVNAPLCCGRVVFVNNTVECGPDGDLFYSHSGALINTSDVTHVCVTVTGPGTGEVDAVIKNNHFITSHATPISGTGRSLIQSNNVTQPRAAALAQGYGFAQFPYKFSPTTVTGATIDAGATLAPDCAIMYTLCSDTRYGVVYDDVAHTVTLLGRTANTRLIGAAWDVGAYEFGQGGAAKPPTPSGLRTHE